MLRELSAHTVVVPPALGAVVEKDRVTTGYCLDDRGGIHHIGNEDVEAGSLGGQPRRVANDGAHRMAGDEALLDHLQTGASCCSENGQRHRVPPRGSITSLSCTGCMTLGRRMQ
jgi:hypothetical protein